MSVEVVFRVRTGEVVYGDAPGMGSGSLDVSRQLSLVGSIPELGAWSLARRVPVHQKPELGEYTCVDVYHFALILAALLDLRHADCRNGNPACSCAWHCFSVYCQYHRSLSKCLLFKAVTRFGMRLMH